MARSTRSEHEQILVHQYSTDDTIKVQWWKILAYQKKSKHCHQGNYIQRLRETEKKLSAEKRSYQFMIIIIIIIRTIIIIIDVSSSSSSSSWSSCWSAELYQIGHWPGFKWQMQFQEEAVPWLWWWWWQFDDDYDYDYDCGNMISDSYHRIDLEIYFLIVI